MNLRIRHWLSEHNLEILTITSLSPGNMAGIAFRIVQDMEGKSLVPFDICTLAEVLELPLDVIRQQITPIADLTASLLRSLSKKKPLKRNEGTWLAFQIAYLYGLSQILAQEEKQQRLWLFRGTYDLHPLHSGKLQALLKTLSPGRLSDTQAEQALSKVVDSLLVQQMNNATSAWFMANGAEEPEAKLLVQRLNHALPGHLIAAIAENAAPLAQLQKFVKLGNVLAADSNNRDILSLSAGMLAVPLPPPATVQDKIDIQREQYRAKLLQNLSEPLFTESFALKDIYVPLKGLPVSEVSFESGKNNPIVDLMGWVEQALSDLETIAVIESEPGYGKTSFCQILATHVAQVIYPHWMPVLIHLRDVTVGNSLAETLNSGFYNNSYLNISDWLEKRYPQCLLILDGLDELPPSPLGKATKKTFIGQLISFQSQCQHKIILTCRLNTLQEISKDLPLQLQRIVIQPFEQDELKQWFQEWSKVQSMSVAQNYFTFLKKAGLFSFASTLPELATLVRQPLMLYFLGVLHRGGLFDEEMLQLARNIQNQGTAPLLWLIYYRLSEWLLGYPMTGGIKTMLLREGSAHVYRTPEVVASFLGDRHPQQMLEFLQTSALQELQTKGQIVSAPVGEFFHSKFGEYFCASEMACKLELLIQRRQNAYGELGFVIDSLNSVAQFLYNLFGYGILSQQIEELLIESLLRLSHRGFSFELLCDRLLSFWYGYCQGRWLDEGIVHNARKHFQALGNPLNVVQIDAATGLNVFLLLCSCSRQAKIPFSPCGNPTNLTEFYPEALSILIAKANTLSKNAFYTLTQAKTLTNLNLPEVNLSAVMLAGSNLEQTNLFNADLTGANLIGANLKDANLAEVDLTGANLAGANLLGVNLAGANLAGANLTGVNLRSVNLTNACLYQAIIADSEKEFALMNGAMFSLEQFQSLKRLLSQHPHLSVPEPTGTSSAWWNTPLMGLIESAEGEPILPMDMYDHYTEDETVLGTDPANPDISYE